MLFLNKGYTWKIDNYSVPNGVILNSSSMPSEQFIRKYQKKNDLTKVSEIIFDPQFYFLQTNNQNVKKTLNYLCTYDWIHDSVVDYDSTQMNIKDYRDAVNASNMNKFLNTTIDDLDELRRRINSCIQFQRDLDFSYCVIPTPLVSDPEDQFSLQLTWIREGLNAIKYKPLPKKEILISIAISEESLLNRDIDNNNLLQTILDNLMALDDVDGFYIVLNRNKENSYLTEPNVINALFEMCYMLGSILKKKVFINYTDVFGFLCLSIGAYAFGTGYSSKSKKFNFNLFDDSVQGGPPLPHFYSHTLISDLFPYRDLGKIKDLDLLHYLKDDVTFASEPLFESLKDLPEQGYSDIKYQIPTWKESKNNISYATNHRQLLLLRETNKVNNLNSRDKILYMLDWLQNAESKMLYINQRLLKKSKEQQKKEELSYNGIHISIWRECYENFIKKYNLK